MCPARGSILDFTMRRNKHRRIIFVRIGSGNSPNERNFVQLEEKDLYLG